MPRATPTATNKVAAPAAGSPCPGSGSDHLQQTVVQREPRDQRQQRRTDQREARDAGSPDHQGRGKGREKCRDRVRDYLARGEHGQQGVSGPAQQAHDDGKGEGRQIGVRPHGETGADDGHTQELGTEWAELDGFGGDRDGDLQAMHQLQDEDDADHDAARHHGDLHQSGRGGDVELVDRVLHGAHDGHAGDEHDDAADHDQCRIHAGQEFDPAATRDCGSDGNEGHHRGPSALAEEGRHPEPFEHDQQPVEQAARHEGDQQDRPPGVEQQHHADADGGVPEHRDPPRIAVSASTDGLQQGGRLTQWQAAVDLDRQAAHRAYLAVVDDVGLDDADARHGRSSGGGIVRRRDRGVRHVDVHPAQAVRAADPEGSESDIVGRHAGRQQASGYLNGQVERSGD